MYIIVLYLKEIIKKYIKVIHILVPYKHYKIISFLLKYIYNM